MPSQNIPVLNRLLSYPRSLNAVFRPLSSSSIVLPSGDTLVRASRLAFCRSRHPPANLRQKTPDIVHLIAVLLGRLRDCCWDQRSSSRCQARQPRTIQARIPGVPPEFVFQLLIPVLFRNLHQKRDAMDALPDGIIPAP